MTPKINTDFLRFNAYSIKNLIIQKLTEDTNFTDQIYLGSNINMLIDLVSYMYQTLIFHLNNAASESMFSDTMIYENINRLIKFLGYNPKGIIPSNGNFYFPLNEEYIGKYILKYSGIDTGRSDSNGNPVYYSVKKDIHVDSTSDENGYFKFKMYNGKWKLYSTVFTASGIDYETFTLDRIGSDINDPEKYVADGCIDVYVSKYVTQSDGTQKRVIEQYKTVDYELFTNNSYDSSQSKTFAEIYTKNDKVVNVRLNENKNYEIKFGNNVIGKRLEENDRIYVFYMETNGNDGVIDLENVSYPLQLKHNASFLGISQNLYNDLFLNSDYNIASSDEVPEVTLENTTTSAVAEESVEDIRRNGPEWFKIGSRLVTTSDFEFYVKNLRRGEVIDCVCQNNYEYMASFYKWLYHLGIVNHNDGSYYLNEGTILKNRYTWSDPSDANNVYIWTKMTDNTSVENLKNQYEDDLQQIKCLTSKVVFQDPINVNFSLTSALPEVVAEQLKDGTYSENLDSYLEVTIDDNILYASGSVSEQIESIIYNYFNSGKLMIGDTIKYNDIIDEIFKINGITRLRTVWLPDENDLSNRRIFEGLCFATWSSSMIDIGDDLTVSNSSRTLEKFQYPVFYDKNLRNRIKVIRKIITDSSTVQV